MRKKQASEFLKFEGKRKTSPQARRAERGLGDALRVLSTSSGVTLPIL